MRIARVSRADRVGGTECADVAPCPHDVAVAGVGTGPDRGGLLDEAEPLGPRRVEHVGGVGAVVDTNARDASLEKVALPALGRLAGEHRRERVRELGIVARARVRGGEPWVLRQPGLADRLGQAGEGVVVVHGQEHPPVGGRVQPVPRVQAVDVGIRKPTWWPSRVVDEVLRQCIRVGGHHPGLHRVPAARPLARRAPS